MTTKRDENGNSIVDCLGCGITCWKGHSEEGTFSYFIKATSLTPKVLKTGWYCPDCRDELTTRVE